MKSKPEEQNKRATNHPTQHHWHEMNRKQRREMMRKMQNEDLSLEVIHPDAGGIDIDRKSTRLNSSHSQKSYADFCLKKKIIKPYIRGDHALHSRQRENFKALLL